VGLLSVLPWVFASVMIGLVAGFFLGRSTNSSRKGSSAERERLAALRVLSELLEATQSLTDDVNLRNTEIRQVEQDLTGIHVDGDLRRIQQALLHQVEEVLKSNLQLENDLTITRLQVEEQAREIDRTRQEARTDELSGVANRKAFDEKLMLMLAALRKRGEQFALVLTDVDHFKWVNDTHGHQAGDNVIAHVGAFLKSCLRERDFVGRYGGDEFAILLGGAGAAEAMKIAERIRIQVAHCNFDIGATEKASITFSMGVAAPLLDDGPAQLLDRADRGLYEAKRQGRNQVHCGLTDGGTASLSQVIDQEGGLPSAWEDQTDESRAGPPGGGDSQQAQLQREQA